MTAFAQLLDQIAATSEDSPEFSGLVTEAECELFGLCNSFVYSSMVNQNQAPALRLARITAFIEQVAATERK